jgi:antitoxin component HigA of HigAB toxin-antitoxin module
MTTPITRTQTSAIRPRSSWAAKAAPLRISTRAQHKAALDELMRLARRMDAGKATRAEKDAAHVLGLLVKDYETARFGELRDNTTPIERLRYLVEESGMSASDLGRLLGDRPLGFRVLTGERELSKAHIQRLADYFNVAPGYFL